MAEYYEGVKKRVELISSVDHPVDLIIDLSGANTNLKDVLTASRYANKHLPPNQRFVMIVGSNLFIKSLVNVLAKILPKISNTIYFVDTLEDAKRLIDEYRAKWSA